VEDYRSSGSGPLRLVSECPIYRRERERRRTPYAGTRGTRTVTEVVITFSIRPAQQLYNAATTVAYARLYT